MLTGGILSLLLSLFMAPSDKDMGKVKYNWGHPMYITVSDGDSNTWSLVMTGLSEFTFEVYDNNRKFLCKRVYYVPNGLTKKERSQISINSGIPETFTADIDGVFNRINELTASRTPALIRYTELAIVFTIGEPVKVKRGDIPMMCGGRSMPT